MYCKLIGPYAQSFFENETMLDVARKRLPAIFRRPKQIYPLNEQADQVLGAVTVIADNSSKVAPLPILPRNWKQSYDKQEMLRDIFIWSVCENHTEIAFILLLQIKSRICAALVGAGMAHHLSRKNKNPHIRSLYRKHREALEEYASVCINECYQQNRRRACQLLLREIPLFGNVTCMQVSYSLPVSSVRLDYGILS